MLLILKKPSMIALTTTQIRKTFNNANFPSKDKITIDPALGIYIMIAILIT